MLSDTTVDQISSHLSVLVQEIGERPGGSPGCRQAETYISQQFAAHGWAVERQPFACPEWQDLGTSLTVNGRVVEAKANAFSLPCSLKARTVPVGTVRELREADLAGRVGVLYGALLPAPLSPKSWFLKSEREDEIIKLLEEKQPGALLTVQQIGAGLERLIEDWEFLLPSATVSAESGRLIVQAEAPMVNLTIQSQTNAGETANIVARSGSGVNRVVICAHHDTKFDTPGACDNASGVAVLLALSEQLDTAAYPFVIELVSFTNEEYLPIGDDEYLRRNGGDDLSAVVACINVDGVGQWLATDSMMAASASTQFESALRRIAAEADLAWAEPWPESNHSTFSFRGVPSVAFTSASRVALAHHPHDNLEWINTRRIALLPFIIKQILDSVAEHELNWTRQS